MWKEQRWWDLSKRLTHTITMFLVIFQLSCKNVAKKAICNFKVIRDDEGRDFILFQNVQNEIFENFQIV